MTAAEEWRPVAEFPSYEVSSWGRVRRVGPSRSGTTYDGKVLKPILNPHRGGYLSAAPVKDGKNHMRYIHRLVAEAFLGPIPPGGEVNHIDCDKTNNRPSNLEYVTRAENMRHSHRSGRVPKGDGHARSKLTEEKVRMSRREQPTTEKEFKRLGEQLGVSSPPSGMRPLDVAGSTSSSWPPSPVRTEDRSAE